MLSGAVLVARPSAAPPDALELCRRIASYPGAFGLVDVGGSSASYFGIDPCDEGEGLDPEPDLPIAPGDWPGVPRWVGVLPYECMRHLERPGLVPDPRAAPSICRATWFRYRAVARLRGGQLDIIGDEGGAMARLERALAAPAATRAASVSLREPVEEPAQHRSRILKALEFIREGEVYQVNLARRFTFDIEGYPLDILASLMRSGPFPHAAALASKDFNMVSTSPELFISLDAERSVVTSPIKGTRPRLSDPKLDERQKLALDKDDKERAELTMVIDVERNDLARIAETGSVQLLQPARVASYSTVHHRAATVGARLRRDLDRRALLEAMLPSGSVTGAPKRRAMELIRDLEPHRRGLYTGAFGALGHDGGLTLGMAIRTLTYQAGVGNYFAGGGIVADSDPQTEVLETGWKVRQLVPGLTGERPLPENWAQ